MASQPISRQQDATAAEGSLGRPTAVGEVPEEPARPPSPIRAFVEQLLHHERVRGVDGGDPIGEGRAVGGAQQVQFDGAYLEGTERSRGGAVERVGTPFLSGERVAHEGFAYDHLPGTHDVSGTDDAVFEVRAVAYVGTG